jgi:branched-chain amino acid transport system substrate-binding protein
MKPFLAPLVAALGAAFGTASLVHAEVLIGLATPLTGHMAWAGASDQVGAESAVADLNAKGGVLGELVELSVVDDACDPGRRSRPRKNSLMRASP